MSGNNGEKSKTLLELTRELVGAEDFLFQYPQNRERAKEIFDEVFAEAACSAEGSGMDVPIPIVIDPTSAAAKAFQSPIAAATGTNPESREHPSTVECEDFIIHDHVIHTKPDIHLFPIDEIYPWITGDTVKLNEKGNPQEPPSMTPVDEESDIIDVTPSSNGEKLAHFVKEWDAAAIHVAKLSEIAQDTLKDGGENAEWTVKSSLAMNMLKVGGQLGNFSQLLTETGTKFLTVIEEEKNKAAQSASFKVPKVPQVPKKKQSFTVPPPQPKIVRPRMWQCKECSKFYPSKQEMDKCCQPTTVSSFKCNICQATFYNQNNLNSHKLSHRQGPYICQICGTLYRELSRKEACVQKHVTSVEKSSTAKQKTYTCDQCGKVYTRREAFKNHMDAHAGQRTYICPICGKGFNNSQTKRVHVFKVHKKMPGPK